MLDEHTVPILTVAPEEQPIERGMFPGPPRMVAKVVDVQMDTIRDNIISVVDGFSKILNNLPNPTEGFGAESVDLSIAISGSGKVALVAEISAQTHAAITVKLTRSRSKTP